MDFIKRVIPHYMFERSKIVQLILLTALFALVFINLYKPFSSSNWYPVSEFQFFVYSSLIILTGVLVVVISRIVMYHWGKRHALSYLGYGLWILTEIICMSLFYSIYTLLLNPERDYLAVFKESLINTSLVLLIPYFTLHLFFSYREKEKRLQQLEEEGAEQQSTKNQQVIFYDERNEFRLSLLRENLLYLEAADNYVEIWYLNKGQVSKFLLRNTLKSLEENLSQLHIVRCHRSYMVNIAQVKVVRRDKEGVFLELGIEKVPDIPISKTYSANVMHEFMDLS